MPSYLHIENITGVGAWRAGSEIMSTCYSSIHIVCPIASHNSSPVHPLMPSSPQCALHHTQQTRNKSVNIYFSDLTLGLVESIMEKAP